MADVNGEVKGVSSHIMEEITKPIKDEIERRKNNPFLLMFSVWWVVFNFDFVLIVLGQKETVQYLYDYYGYHKCSYGNYYSFLCEWGIYLTPTWYFVCYKILFPLFMCFVTLGIMVLSKMYNKLYWGEIRESDDLKRSILNSEQTIKELLKENEDYRVLLGKMKLEIGMDKFRNIINNTSK